jgi:hypothetical protein
LVLDWVNSSEGSPVLSIWDSDLWKNGWLWDLSLLVVIKGGVDWSSVSEKFFVLLVGPGGHEVVANGESVFWVGVDLLEFLSVSDEDSLSELEFFLGSVRDTVSRDVLEEIEVGGKLFLESELQKS